MPSKKASSRKAATKVPAPMMPVVEKQAPAEAEAPLLPGHVATQLAGSYTDQFDTVYEITAAAEPDAYDVVTRRSGAKPRCTKALIQIKHSHGDCQIYWGGSKPGTKAKYVVKSVSASRIVWSRPSEQKDFDWTRKKQEDVDPAPTVAAMALGDESDAEAPSDVESEYGLSDNHLAALGMKPNLTCDWPLSRSEKKTLLAMRTQSILRSHLHEGIREIQALQVTIQRHEDTIKKQQEELAVLRKIVALRCDGERSSVMPQRQDSCKECQMFPAWSMARSLAVDSPSGAGSTACGSGSEHGSPPEECHRRPRISDDGPVNMLAQRMKHSYDAEPQQAIPVDPAIAAPPASAPEPQSKRLSDAGGGDAVASVRVANGPSKEVSTRGRTSDAELKRWMERMRGRCQIVESAPDSMVADAAWSHASQGGQGAGEGGGAQDELAGYAR